MMTRLEVFEEARRAYAGRAEVVWNSPNPADYPNEQNGMYNFGVIWPDKFPAVHVTTWGPKPVAAGSEPFAPFVGVILSTYVLYAD